MRFLDRDLTPEERAQNAKYLTTDQTLSRWLDSECLHLNGGSVNRRDLISYVARFYAGQPQPEGRSTTVGFRVLESSGGERVVTEKIIGGLREIVDQLVGSQGVHEIL